LRVISGSARGSKLLCPDGLSVRPTHDRVKEAVFSMLGHEIVRANALDLFAGTGSLGIESLSRGASSCVFVDISPISLSVVKENLHKTHLTDKATLLKSDYISFLTHTDSCFDIIFLDPPYREGYLQTAISLIAKRHLLKSGGLLYCETDTELDFPIPENFSVVRNKKYGRARVLLLRELSL